MEILEYTRHIFVAKSWPISVNYGLHQVAKDIALNDESHVKTDQQNFYFDDFLKSVRSAQEAIQRHMG